MNDKVEKLIDKDVNEEIKEEKAEIISESLYRHYKKKKWFDFKLSLIYFGIFIVLFIITIMVTLSIVKN